MKANVKALPAPRGFVFWLWSIAALIFCMVIVGGATRLTDSGLSITEWQPILGALPPLSEAAWQEAFEKYKLIPQFKLNPGMTLDDFKFIYGWEWSHRLLGRVIGFAVLLPLIWFAWKGQISKSLWKRLALLFVLGGLQGALGWFMVASGLQDRTDVSQYRLAAHLSLAVLLFAAFVWTALGAGSPRGMVANRAAFAAGVALLVAVFVQIAAGGFVAGLDAGHAADTWPLMNGALIPDGLGVMQPAWKNLFENALTVQFDHRMLAYAIVLAALINALWLRHSSAWAIVAVLLLQVLLGILVVVWQVPLSTALIHQGGALVVLTFVLRHLHRQFRPDYASA